MDYDNDDYAPVHGYVPPLEPVAPANWVCMVRAHRLI